MSSELRAEHFGDPQQYCAGEPDPCGHKFILPEAATSNRRIRVESGFVIRT